MDWWVCLNALVSVAIAVNGYFQLRQAHRHRDLAKHLHQEHLRLVEAWKKFEEYKEDFHNEHLKKNDGITPFKGKPH